MLLNVKKTFLKEKELILRLNKNHINWDTTIIITDTLSILNIPVYEPFFADIKLYNTQKKMISETGSFLITPDSINVNFFSFGNPGKITGGENEYIDENGFILFDMPLGLYRSLDENIGLIRQDTILKTTNGNLYIRYEQYKNLITRTIKTYPGFYFLLYKLNQNRDYFTADFLEYSTSLFTDYIKGTALWEKLKLYVSNEKKLTVKNTIPQFKVENRNNEIFSQRDMIKKGKYTFIDFWASWCVPCRKDMQKLKELYSKIDTSKIAIVSISIDNDRKEWLNAEKAEKILWDSYVDIKENVKSTFNLDYIPQGVIINEQGVIEQRLVSFDDLKDFLSKQGLLRTEIKE